MIDLRSDTLTKPSPEMRQYIAQAEVGDDIFGEDPTVNRLQEMAVKITGKEAALYTSSGTQANQIAIKAHTQPGDEIITEQNAHIAFYESGSPAFLSQVMIRTVPGQNGIMTAGDIKAVLRPSNIHFPPTRLIALENTHNKAGGVIYPIEIIKDIKKLAVDNSLNMHLDGARIFNASVATGIPVKEYADNFDSVSFCLSKGLGAPVGSLLCGSKEFIERALRIRKMVGGGMRQAGIIAAGGIYSLEHNVDRLKEDHKNARRLAEIFNSFSFFSVDMDTVQTNIVMVDINGDVSEEAVVEDLSQNGIACFSMGPKRMRFVTHLDVSAEEIEMVGEILKKMY